MISSNQNSLFVGLWQDYIVPNAYYILIVLVGFICHGLLLISDGLVWDGWEVASWISSGQWHYFRQLCHDSGHNMALVANWPFLFVGNVVAAYKIVGFLLIVAIGPLCYYLSLRFNFLNRKESLILALLAMTYPGFSLAGDPSVFFYQLGFFLYLGGAILVMFCVEKHGWRHWLFRLFSLVLFATSFMMQALLVFHFGFLLLLLVKDKQSKDLTTWRQSVNSLLKKMDYILLPFIFFFLKTMLNPTKGVFKSYYSFDFSFAKYFRAYQSLFERPVFEVITKSFSILFANSYIFIISLILFVVVWLYTKNTKDKLADAEKLSFPWNGVLCVAVALFAAKNLQGHPHRILYLFATFSFIFGVIALSFAPRLGKYLKVWFKSLGMLGLFFGLLYKPLYIFYVIFLAVLLFDDRKSGFVNAVKKNVVCLLLPISAFIVHEISCMHVSSKWLVEVLRARFPGWLFELLREWALFLMQYGFLVIIPVTLFFFIWLVRFYRTENDSEKQSLNMLFVGVLWLVLSAFPYAVVGQAFDIQGWASKNSVLLGIPLAIILVALVRIAVRKYSRNMARVVLALSSVLILGFSSLNIVNYINWQALAVKDHSSILNLSKIKHAKQISIFHVNNEYIVPGTIGSYPGLIWSYIFKNSFDDKEIKKMFISEAPRNGMFYEKDQMMREHLPEVLPYTLKELDYAGRQAKLTIRPGPNHDNSLKLTLRYWYIKFFRSQDLNQYLEGVTSLSLKPILFNKMDNNS